MGIQLRHKVVTNGVMRHPFILLQGDESQIAKWFNKRVDDRDAVKRMYSTCDAFVISLDDTDKMRIFVIGFNVEYISNMTPYEIAGIVAHEALHLLHQMYTYINVTEEVTSITKDNEEFLARAIEEIVENVYAEVMIYTKKYVDSLIRRVPHAL